MVEHTRFKALSSKMETVMAVLDQKEEKDRAKDERMAIIEQSLASIAKCMESLQLQNSLATTSPSVSNLENSTAMTEMRYQHPPPWRATKMDLARFDGNNAL